MLAYLKIFVKTPLHLFLVYIVKLAEIKQKSVIKSPLKLYLFSTLLKIVFYNL